MFYQIFHSPQVKQWAIITDKTTKDLVAKQLETYNLRKLENMRNVSKLHRMIV